MKKPQIILKDNLIVPIVGTEARIYEIKNELRRPNTNISLNGLFVMLVSFIESMQKEIIKHYLKYCPEKVADNSIEVDKAIFVENEDFYFLERVISDYIDKMPYWRLSKLFYKLLGINKPLNDNEVQNIKKRRNELIHKNLEVNFKRKEAKQDSIEVSYLSTCLNEYSIYLSHLKSEISTSYLKCSKINALENLWYYTFKTPLCANFSDYWYIDNEEDIISGCKYPDIENGLSSGERFMLEVWRSQVCGCKVNFLNMASIDNHYQHCLYVFLKLSNDIFLYG